MKRLLKSLCLLLTIVFAVSRAETTLAAQDKVKVLKKASKADVLTTSGVTGQGVDQVLYRVLAHMDAEKAALAEAERRKTEPTWVP